MEPGEELTRQQLATEYGKLTEKVNRMYTDLYTHDNGEPVVTTFRELTTTLAERDRAQREEQKAVASRQTRTIALASIGVAVVLAVLQHYWK